MFEIFFIIGAVLILGFITSQIFERTKIPDIIILMFAGILFGSVLEVYNINIKDPIVSMAPFIGTLALIILLFDGGLNLNLFKVLTALSKAAVFTVLVFIFTVLLVGISMSQFFGWPYLYGFLLGAVVGGTSSAVVLPLVSKLSMSEKSKVILSLESAMTDALCIIVSIALIEVIVLGTVDLRDTLGTIASAFSTAAVIGAIFAIFWVEAVSKVYIRQVGYTLTLAVVFILYSLVELVKSSGAIAVLVFALLLSNFNDIAKKVKMAGEFTLDTALHTCQVNVSFFVHTFFFIFVGLMINIDALRDATTLRMAAIIFIFILAARIAAVKLLVASDKVIAPFGTSMMLMMSRGLAAAVLASLPVQSGIMIPNFEEIAFSLIILTNLATTIAVFFLERRAGTRSGVALKV